MSATAERRVTEARVRAHAPDYGLLTTVLVLLVLGLIFVYSSSYVLAQVDYGDPNYFIKRQLLFAAIGLVGLVAMMQFDYRHLRRLSPLLMLGALLGLAAVLIPGVGVESNGALRWIQLGPLPPLQPSEFAKLAVLIYMAAWLASRGDALKNFSLGVLPFVGMVGLVGALIMLEPDLGTTVMIAIITGTLFFIAGARLVHVIALAGSGIVMASLLIASGGYRMDRILSFTSAESDPTGVGFHTLQLLVAFGSGGVWGLGLGVSRQKFFYVPGSHTDGVLAIIGEEIGFVGVTVVLSLFLVLFWRAWLIMRRAPDTFGSLIAAGVLAWFAFQLLLNVGGVTRLIPLTGIPLPFLSAGGSSLLVSLLAIGLLLSVSRYAAFTPEPARPRGVQRAQTSATGGAR
ncbi:MAG: putative lipid II flippase FtsW [Chloroflexi bacterium]|nr:putative lipid II flippase FtsW [Chloroflexota bacterium]MDA1147478.1 putative lipid II flippase FtsW [Chloroflexota bacterium]MQC83029.1 putative lipid II flippase FtsW [Chloroflexota bacterium]PKB56605.1 MAG: putative lipid II flippase FtsW [SAR202 cluster bacterium Casp-Chloro-G1]